MEVKQLIEEIQQHYSEWKRERDLEGLQTHTNDVESYLASWIYDYGKALKEDAESLQAFVKGIDELEYELFKACELQNVQQIFENINNLIEPHRTRRLSDLMTSLERQYGIPMMNNEQFNQQHQELMTLYRSISAAREF